MVATSMVVMYAFTYLNVFAFAHVHWSETRAYMTLMMGAAMTVIMLAYMWSMYGDARINVAIIIGSVLVFSGALWLMRSQATVGDSSYMRAMIPHHSIAILTSERAGIEDVRVRELADGISDAQRREIKEMDWLLDDIDDNGVAGTDGEARDRPVPEFAP
jgi:uncharacterized protein (DUF305 family)